MKRLVLFTIIFFAITADFRAFAQDTIPYRRALIEMGTVVPGLVVDGDTLPHVRMREIIVFPPRVFENRRQQRRYTRLVRYVKKVYPYAVTANQTLRDIDEHLATLDSERERKAYVDQAEEELRAEFEQDLRELTITQGMILIKLIDRETGETSYELVKELRGSLSAFFWQGIARLFGSNLKAEYDKEGDDAMIEEIVVKIENGQL